jgi:hypothetical protein
MEGLLYSIFVQPGKHCPLKKVVAYSIQKILKKANVSEIIISTTIMPLPP